MAKSKTPTYVLTLQLKTTKYDEIVLNKRLEIGRHLYNSVLGQALERYKTLAERKQYRKLKQELKDINKKYHNCNDKKKITEINKIRNAKYKELKQLHSEFGLDEYSLINNITPMYKPFKKNIDSRTAQAIASRSWKAMDKLINGDSKKVYFKRFGEFNSIENGYNKSGLKCQNGYIIWNGLEIPIIIKNNDTYAQKAIQDKVKFCRIARKEVKGKTKYYVQLILEGIPPKKINKKTGKTKGQTGNGNVGIDIGTQTIAISSEYDVKLLELAPSINNIDREIKLLQRYMDRSRRSMNPKKYNEDGTIKRGNKDKWIFSNRYLKAKARRKELYRKQTEIRRQDHYKMINWLLILGDKFYVEDMNYKGLQARSKKTSINEKTKKFNKKKRFGKSLANKSPSALLTMINNKLKYNDEKLYKIDTKKCKCSQYNHFTDEYNKKELKDRWNKDIEIQRDLYSSFLIMNVTGKKLDKIDRNRCIETYDNFKILHDKEINRLKELKRNGYKLISSMGI
ncbi:TPA: transposase [Clostridium botulinum]|nr:transposase [Clostridium botulinum]